jgi:predicted acylesterase/phospholipase RssA
MRPLDPVRPGSKPSIPVWTAWPVSACTFAFRPLELLVLALLPLLLAAVAGAQTVVPATSTPRLVRVGYTTFEKPDKVLSGQTSLESVTAFLETLSKSPQHPLDFDLHLGNYYQILSWLESKDLDAAVVSPFVAGLLKEKGIASPLVEFTQGDNEDGHWGVVCSSDASGRRENDYRAYDAYLGELLAEAEKHPDECAHDARSRRYRINAVAHLSTTGFIAPVLYASDWLTAQKPSAAIEERFWDCYFDNIKFTLAHSGKCDDDLPGDLPAIAATPGPPRPPEINFDWTAKRPPADARQSRFGFDGSATAPPPIPNDVLMVRPEFKELLEKQLRSSAKAPDIHRGSGRSTYTGVLPYKPNLHKRFEEQVTKLLAIRALRSRFIQWYGLGRYDFSIGDIKDFLGQDQELSDKPRLSLVLPGGGVKSAYQAEMLDRLYGERVLINSGSAGMNRDALVVADVVGTSGGAMVGLFTAQKKAAGDEHSLRHLWEPGPKVFPPFDLLRWTSLFAILLLFFVLFYLARIASLLDLGRVGARISLRRTPYWLSFVLLAILFGGPLLVSWISSNTLQTEIPWAEGLLYLLTILAVYVALSCCVNREPRVEAPAKRFLAPSTFALLSAAGLVAVGFVAKQPIAVSLGLLVTVLGAGLLAREWKLGLQLAGVRDCVRALSLLGLVFAVSYAVFALLSLSGWATFIELTPAFWLILLLSAGAVSIACFAVAQRGDLSFGRYARRALRHFATVHRLGRIRAEHAQSLTILFGMGLLWWSWAAAPAIYSGKIAYESFKSIVGTAAGGKGVDQPLALRTNLIVTATALDDVKDAVRLEGSKQRLPLPAGDIYFCFRGPAGCPQNVQSKRWFEIREPSVRKVVDPVFASGSPFPVFPPHPVTWDSGGPATARLVDGGYAHNIPLQAASLAGARQVLIVRSEPLAPSAVRRSEIFPSQLARYIELLLPFLYEQAQEIDRSVARGLVVTSLSPYATGGKVPLLTDFDAVTIHRMLHDADEDFDRGRRIGLVESWGLPVVFRQIRVGKAAQNLYRLNRPGS